MRKLSSHLDMEYQALKISHPRLVGLFDNMVIKRFRSGAYRLTFYFSALIFNHNVCMSLSM